MCRVTRRELLLSSAALFSLTKSDWELLETLGVDAHAAALPEASKPEVGKVDLVAEGIYFHQGNLLRGHCNNGW
ncbi:MAG: hypothetical protein M3X11_09880 [Acidobacteriota bacterium]|nr:hypothetical protein [Acidobacteriota bacterium]